MGRPSIGRDRTLLFLRHGFWSDRKSFIFGVWAAPAHPNPLPNGGALRAPPFGRVFLAAWAAQTRLMSASGLWRAAREGRKSTLSAPGPPRSKTENAPGPQHQDRIDPRFRSEICVAIRFRIVALMPDLVFRVAFHNPCYLVGVYCTSAHWALRCDYLVAMILSIKLVWHRHCGLR